MNAIQIFCTIHTILLMNMNVIGIVILFSSDLFLLFMNEDCARQMNNMWLQGKLFKGILQGCRGSYTKEYYKAAGEAIHRNSKRLKGGRYAKE